MSYQDLVTDLGSDAEQLEQVYQSALQAGETDAFQQAIDAGHEAAPDNLLYAAWYYRLQQAAVKTKETFVAWGWAIPLALLNGLVLWAISDTDRFMIQAAGLGSVQGVDLIPWVLLLAAPISAVFVMAYLTLAGHKEWRLPILIGLGLLAAVLYVDLIYPQLGTRTYQEQYLSLMLMHLPLLAWAGVGMFLLAGHHDPTSRFAFLIKSLEIFVMGGLFLIAGVMFTGITFSLFNALGINPPEVVMRLFAAGGGGLIPVLATAVIYNPNRSPAGQSFSEGLSKLVALLLRVLLPLTLVVLVVYIVFILFNFREPFENRDVLVIYNIMLFAVVALLVGATPVSMEDVSPTMARWLRRGIMAVAVLALIVSIYALVAILYRTGVDRLTPNRLAFIGWDIVNIGLLALLLFLQVRAGSEKWLPALHQAFSYGAVAYAVWTLVVILLLPWMFGSSLKAAESLPVSVQDIVYEYPDPVLLKCIGSDHIYLLDQGEKRWIDSIDTFEDRGYNWQDVHFLPCDDLRSVPDGTPIPADAGPPPQP